MSSLEIRLDSLAARAARAAAPDCGCARCRAGAASSGETARPARRRTSAPAAGTRLPGWRGWTPPASLLRIGQARAAARAGRPVPPALAPFLAPGPQVYRLTRIGMDRGRPLSIGMTESRGSIAQRISEHYSQPSRADPGVHRAIRNLQPGQILVQAARLDRMGMNPRRARDYEGWLQDRERPLLYDPDSTTFDEAGGARFR
jgi:hypothetical protein